MNTTLLKTNRPSSSTLVNFVSSVLSHSPNSGYTYASLPLKFPLETSYVRKPLGVIGRCGLEEKQ